MPNHWFEIKKKFTILISSQLQQRELAKDHVHVYIIHFGVDFSPMTASLNIQPSIGFFNLNFKK